MRNGLATYSPWLLVVAVSVCPWSTSVTMTMAFGTTAPLGSLTVPTMLPASFCAQAGLAKASKHRVETKGITEREPRFHMVTLLGVAPEVLAFMRHGNLRRRQSFFWDRHLLAYSYERLLLVSIWCVCQEKLTSVGAYAC